MAWTARWSSWEHACPILTKLKGPNTRSVDSKIASHQIKSSYSCPHEWNDPCDSWIALTIRLHSSIACYNGSTSLILRRNYPKTRSVNQKIHLIRFYRRTAIPTNRSIRTIRETLLRPVSIRLMHVVAHLYAFQGVYESQSNLWMSPCP